MIWGDGSFKLERRDLLEFERRDFLFSGVLLRRDFEHQDFCIGFSWWLQFEVWACIISKSMLVLAVVVQIRPQRVSQVCHLLWWHCGDRAIASASDFPGGGIAKAGLASFQTQSGYSKNLVLGVVV